MMGIRGFNDFWDKRVVKNNRRVICWKDFEAYSYAALLFLQVNQFEQI